MDEWRAQLHQRVAEEYPETEAEKPEAEREGAIPTSVLEVLEEREKDAQAAAAGAGRKITSLAHDKNATPGDGERSLDTCLFDSRPMSAVQAFGIALSMFTWGPDLDPSHIL